MVIIKCHFIVAIMLKNTSKRVSNLHVFLDQGSSRRKIAQINKRFRKVATNYLRKPDQYGTTRAHQKISVTGSKSLKNAKE